jgi:acyl-CoA thioester hydrolase
MNKRFSCRVYYEDTDCGGVVYYANYLRFFERARSEYLRQAGIYQQQLAQDEDIIFVVKSCNIIYHYPARLDDLLTITSQIVEFKQASITMNQQITINDNKIASLNVLLACIDKTTFKPRRLPLIITSLNTIA